MAVLDAAALVGAIGVAVAAFSATMAFIEVAIVRQRTILQLNVKYRPARLYRVERLAA